jgi:hypothetical protein
LIAHAQEALHHINALTDHFIRLNRPEAVARLDDALCEAEGRIERAPWAGLPAPRPYTRLR